MEWWVYLLIFIALIFVAFVIYFVFLVPRKENLKKQREQLKRHPNRVVDAPEKVKLFTNFAFNKLPEVAPDEAYRNSGLYGFYVDAKMTAHDSRYPIFIAVDQKDLWQGMQTTKKALNEHDPRYQNVYEYLELTNQKLENLKFFIIEDYNPDNYSYWNETLETDVKGFNIK